MTTSTRGINRSSKVIVLSAVVALMLSLLPVASALAAPAAPSTPNLAAGSDTGNSTTDNITMTLNGLVFTGTAQVGSTVTIYVGGSTVIGTAVAAVDGSYSVTTTTAISDDAANSITATATDGTGESPQSAALIVTTDNTNPGAPSAPDLAAASDTGISPTDNITADTTPTFTGTSAPNASVELYADAVLVGSVIATGTSWSITSSALTAGTYTFTAFQTDAAGNGPSVASPGLSVTINTSVPPAPSAPNLDAASDTGTSSTDNITADPTPTFSGTAEAGSTVELFAGVTSVGTAVATGGNWQITSSALTSGTYQFTARATNVAGTSAASSALQVTIQTALDVTINQATGQNDPTAASPINFTVVFTNAVSNFASSDVTIAGTAGGVKTVTVTGSGTTYNVAVSGMTTLGTVIASIGASVASDAAGNNNAASTSTDNSVTWDPTPGPTVTINQASGQADPTGTSPINFTIVFSAPVSGFTASDVVITGTATGTKTVTLTGSGPTYNAAVSGMTSSGTVIATIPAGAALGVTGNHPTVASTTADNTVTFRLASKWIVTSSNSTPTPGTVVTITAQLADATNVAVPTSGVVVTWSKTGTGGTFSAATSTTNASGIATVSFTVGTTVGTIYTVTATSPGPITGTSGNITVTASTTTLTLSSSRSITTYRDYITLTAQFSGTAGANRVVAIQRMTRVLPGTWVTIATATTNSAGRATFSYGPPYNTQFRAVFAGATNLSAVTSSTITVNVRHKALIRPGANATTVVRFGTRITYTATVRPIAPAGVQRVTFLVYKKVGGVWTFRTSATMSTSSGAATFSWRWGRGEWYVRVRSNATIYNLASLSPLSKVTVR